MVKLNFSWERKFLTVGILMSVISQRNSTEVNNSPEDMARIGNWFNNLGKNLCNISSFFRQ